MSEDKRSFTYKRFMRDGTVEERHGVSGDPRRIRTGKTAKDKNKRHHKEE
jgi:hypothetical protein